jgi:hypothetical protein
MNNVLDPADVGAPVPRSRQLIYTEAVKLRNLDINNAGGVSVRKGRTNVLNAAGLSSGWSNPYDPAEAYFVNGTVLNRLNADGSIAPVKFDLIPGLPVVFCQVNDVVCYSNGQQYGIIENGVDTPVTHPGQVDTFGGVSVGNNKQRMPAGRCMDFYNGRLYMLVDSFGGVDGCALVCCDDMTSPNALESMEMAPTGPNPVAVFTGKANMVARIESRQGGGLFVSAGDETFWLQGTDPMVEGGMSQLSVAPYAAIPGTAYPIKGELLGIQGLAGNCLMWASTRGVCVGAAGGYFNNVTQDRFMFPAAAAGSALVREQNGLAHFICALQGLGAVYNEFVS